MLDLTPADSALESTPSRWVDFYELTKPRMNFLVVITTMVGFLLGSPRGLADWILLLNAIIGTALCAASASVLNQLMERRYDALMPRTRNRPLPAGRIAPSEALWFGSSLALAGVVVLASMVNVLTAVLGAVTIAWYLGLYTPAKRITSLNTVIGAVPGAIPPMMGFTAAQGTLSPAALALFGILFFWQMPHFLAIAWLCREDYRSGGFPMLTVTDPSGTQAARQAILYGAALVPVSLLPTPLKLLGPVYFWAALALGIAYLMASLRFGRDKSDASARRLMFASILYLPALLGAMLVDRILF